MVLVHQVLVEHIRKSAGTLVKRKYGFELNGLLVTCRINSLLGTWNKRGVYLSTIFFSKPLKNSLLPEPHALFT